MLTVVGTIPNRDFPLLAGKVTLENGEICIQDKRVPARRGTLALLAAPLRTTRHLTSPFVFWKRNGHPFSESWARKLYRRVCKQMGVDIGLYQSTKHSSATDLADREGWDFTQEFIGHKKPNHNPKVCKDES